MKILFIFAFYLVSTTAICEDNKFSDKDKTNHSHKKTTDNKFVDNSEYKIYVNICLENQWNTNIDANHYLDDGCTCRACTKQRRFIVVKARRGEPPKEKLTHALAIQKWRVAEANSSIHHPKPPSNPAPNSIGIRKRIQNKPSALKHGLMDNILETRINPW